MNDETSSDDEDYHAYEEPDHIMEKRYPVHDCCEFEDIDELRKLLYVVADDNEDEDDEAGDEGGDEDDDENDDDENDDEAGLEGNHPRRASHRHGDDSSSDDNDSTAAAHAAAIGHSPQPLKLAEPQPDTHTKPENGTTSIDEIKKEAVQPQGKPLVAMAQSEGIAQISAEPTQGLAHISETKQEKEAIQSSVCASASTRDTEPNASAEIAGTQAGTEVETDAPVPMEIDGSKEKENETHDGIRESNGISANPTEADKTPDQTDSLAKENESRGMPSRMELNRSINLNERDDDENTPLHIAIHARKLEHVKLLLEAGASFRMRCDGSWPIHTAISLGAISEHRQFAYECVVLLHEHGADLTIKDESLHTPLYLACMFNLPQIVAYLLSDDDGLCTLNTRADRAGNRPLHVAAKFDTPDNPSFSRNAAASATGQIRPVSHHHPDGTVSTVRAVPAFLGKMGRTILEGQVTSDAEGGAASTEALLTQNLLGTTGIEVDATNVMGQTPLHIACMRGNWPVARLLLQGGASPSIADRRGFTPGQLAYKRGMPIPNDLVDVLGDPPETGIITPIRDLIVDPNGSTILLCHELCLLHRTCPPIRRNLNEPPPENVRRLQVLVDPHTGILRTGEFAGLVWKDKARRAAIGDVLKIHEYSYIESISALSSSIPDHPSAIAHLDPDTTISRWSFEAAMRAAGSVCEAVDRVVAGDCRNAFCAVRPPGHHAGPRGLVKCANDPEGGSHGFCLLNNVAIGAAYARTMYRHEGIRKVAIIDFDVHHGNGTEAIIRQLVPTLEKSAVRTSFAYGELCTTSYRPWLDETDIQDVFFASTHGYGNRGYDQPGWFYPASGKTHTSEAITRPAMVETPNLSDFLLSQTWTRMGEDSKANCCKIINVGLALPDPDHPLYGGDPQSRSIKQRLELRDTYRQTILPHLRDFDPDLIFISAGFDAHRKDSMNFGYVGMVEEDYEWVTEQLVKVANTCCNGRIISVLEGGYKIHGGIVSPFARAVASHVRALVDGGRSRELYDLRDGEWEGQFERHLFERRERKREQERELLRQAEDEGPAHTGTRAQRSHHIMAVTRSFAAATATVTTTTTTTTVMEHHDQLFEAAAGGEPPEDIDAPTGSRKRRRNQVDYKELFKQMQQEGFAG